MTTTRRRWIPIVVGILILLVFVAIGAVLAGVMWFQQHVETTATTDAEAQREFDVIRQKYAARPPLLEMVDGEPRYTGGTPPPTPTPGRTVTLDSLHVLVWDPREEKLIRLSLPFWLLRMKSEPIRLSAYASGMDDRGVSLRPQDIEQHGPGILLEMTTPSRERILVWTQ